MPGSRRCRALQALAAGSALLALTGGLAGCSGRGSSAEALASVAAGPTGPCDKAGFATHAGLAAGAVRVYVWQPFAAGAFKTGAKDRAKALTTAAAASKLAAGELAAAGPLVTGCVSGVRLQNAIGTGTSLATAAGNQFASAKPNTETLAGANSIITTVLDEAKAIGIPVTQIEPSAAQLTG